MERGSSFVEVLFLLAFSLLVLGGIGSMLQSGLQQQRRIGVGFRLLQDLESGRDYLMAQPFLSPELAAGRHESRDGFPHSEWVVIDQDRDLKVIVLRYVLNGAERNFRFFKSRFVQEVGHV